MWTVPEVPWWGVVSSAAAPVLLIGGWTVAAALQRAGFDLVTGTVSALAALDADDRWVMTAALAGLGCCHVTTAAALRPAALPGRLLLAAGGVGTVLVAAFPQPAGDGSVGAAPRRGRARLRRAGRLAGLRLAPPTGAPGRDATRAAGRHRGRPDPPGRPGRPARPAGSGRRRPGPTGAAAVGAGAGSDGAVVPVALRPAVAGAAAAVLLGLVGWFVVELATDGPVVGLAERVAAGAQAIWPLLVVLSARSRA